MVAEGRSERMASPRDNLAADAVPSTSVPGLGLVAPMNNLLNATHDEILEIAVDEAIARLAYLTAAARPALMTMLQDDRGLHPRALCTAHRKAGHPLTRDELRAIGLRANAFMSQQAFAEITAAGRANSLDAHMLTLLRAVFTVSRWKTLRRADALVRDGVVKREALLFTYDMLPPVCPRCAELDGEGVTPETAHILPVPIGGLESDQHAVGARSRALKLANPPSRAGRPPAACGKSGMRSRAAARDVQAKSRRGFRR